MTTQITKGDVVGFTGFGANNAHRYLYFVEGLELLESGKMIAICHWIDNNGCSERLQNKIPVSSLMLYSGPIDQERYSRR